MSPDDVMSSIRKAGDPGIAGAVVAFERTLEVDLSLGVRIEAHYTPAEGPALSFKFTCNYLNWTFPGRRPAWSAELLSNLTDRILDRVDQPELRQMARIVNDHFRLNKSGLGRSRKF